MSDDGVASDAAELSDESMEDEDMFEDEETKSRFTNYSMTSSVIRRNEGLTLLDDRFEKVTFCQINHVLGFSLFIDIFRN